MNIIMCIFVYVISSFEQNATFEGSVKKQAVIMTILIDLTCQSSILYLAVADWVCKWLWTVYGILLNEQNGSALKQYLIL